MRAGAFAGFRLDPSFVLEDARVLALDAASLGGLVRLLCAAWRAGCMLPADPAKLAAISGLGVAWAGSALAGAIGDFFCPCQGGVAPVDLLPQQARREATSEARSAAGRASGEARRTLAEHLSNICSTLVEQTPAAAPLAAPEERNPLPRVQLGQEPEARPGPGASVEHLFDTCPANHSGKSAKAETPSVCARKDLADAAAPGGADDHAPPHPLIERDQSSSKSLSGGGVGGQPRLFEGMPAEPPRRPRKASRPPTPRQEHLDAAKLVVASYAASVASEHLPGQRAVLSVAALLAGGYTREQLEEAARNYARHCDQIKKTCRYRRSADNFYSADGEWRTYLEWKDDGAKKFGAGGGGVRRVGSAGRVPAPEGWYEHFYGTPEPPGAGAESGAAAALPAPQGPPDRPDPFAVAPGDQ